MPKMLTPGFPPRRPSGVVRYLLVAAILFILFYIYNADRSPEAVRPGTIPSRPVPDNLAKPPSRPPPATGDHPLSDSKPSFGSEFEEDDKTVGKPKPKPDSQADTKTDSETDTETDSKPDSKTGSKTDSKTETYEDEEEEEEVKKPGKGSGKTTSPKGKGSGVNYYDDEDDGSHGTSEATLPSGPEDAHPIDGLIYDAQLTFGELTSKETKTIEEAAQAYRKRRGRHPPPGFDLWFQFAQNNSALIVEDFFDQIYNDLEPYWGMDPSMIRKESWDWEMTINIRDGEASTGSDWFWTVIWLNLIKTIEHLLPDMDLALNAMDEPRLVVPWEDINGYMKKAAKTVNLPKAKTVRSDFQKLPKPGDGDLMTETRKKDWEDTSPYWAIARRGCHPDSLARTAPMQESFADPPEINMTNAEPHLYQGFVSNYTMSTDLCHQPDLQGLEGILIAPLSTSATKVLFPMFGGSKLGVNNEILLPAPMYWNEEERFTGGDDHGPAWPLKHNKAVWRGVATGGRNRPENWRGFQRHRFVSMNNGTKLAATEKGEHTPENFALPEEDRYNLAAQREGKLGEWVSEWADIAFVDLMCDPPTPDGSCAYTDHYFERLPGMSMADQFDSKYIPDIDGNSFSGRYLGFLRSTSLPIKSAIWREWHDSRLVAWKHFVPMDSRFGDYYGIMDYFVGYQGKGGHDSAAEKIAMDGKEWAEKVLRKEDMQIYTLRLLLEYARVLDDRREHLGWVDDVLKDPSLEKTWSWWW